MWAEDVPIEFVDGGYDVEDLWQDQGGESDGDNTHKRLFKEFEAHYHDDDALVDAYPDPDEECFGV